MQLLLAEMKPKLEQAARATARMIEKITLDTVSIVSHYGTGSDNESEISLLKINFKRNAFIIGDFNSY